MRSGTDALVLNLSRMLTDPDRPDAEKVALAKNQVALIIARRKTARHRRRVLRLVNEWVARMTDRDPGTE